MREKQSDAVMMLRTCSNTRAEHDPSKLLLLHMGYAQLSQLPTQSIISTTPMARHKAPIRFECATTQRNQTHQKARLHICPPDGLELIHPDIPNPPLNPQILATHSRIIIQHIYVPHLLHHLLIHLPHLIHVAQIGLEGHGFDWTACKGRVSRRCELRDERVGYGRIGEVVDCDIEAAGGEETCCGLTDASTEGRTKQLGG